MGASREQGFINHYRKVIFFIVTIAIFAYWILTEPLWIELSDGALLICKDIGILCLIIGIFGRVFATMTIGGKKNSAVINTELYSTIRHPLYFFSLFLFLGVGFIIGRIDMFILLVVAFYGQFLPIMINEEKFLSKKLGQDYVDFSNKTPRLFPKFSNFTYRENIQINTKLVIKTFLDGALTFAIIPLIDIINYIKSLNLF